MQAEEFYRRVATRLNTSTDRAKAVTLTTLDSLRHRLTQEMAEDLAAQLPRDMEHALNDPAYDDLYDDQLFVGPLMNMSDTQGYWDKTLGGMDLVAVHNGDDVSREVKAVFGVIKECVQPSTARYIADSLPDGIEAWFAEADEPY